MEDLLGEIQLQPEKAKPVVRYIATAIEYFVFLSTYNLFRPIHNDSPIWGLSFIVIWIFYFPLMGNYWSNIRQEISKYKSC